MPDITLEAEADLLHSLEEWLRDVDALRGRVRLLTPPPAPGRMGAPPELRVAVETGAQATALSRTVELWLRVRGAGVTLKLRVGRRVTELDLRGEVDVDRLARQVDAVLREALHAAGQ
ncbi:effector-associated constant component EACC1 [Nonomuraea typhae]|uniref:effector-associated constant component EACC1 n=1 Tax=Nonomuraea typhae TaxID=2603600 RepID=UPI0012FA4CE1|nr:hypothetical protein [Nonomuraea typhae]